MGVSNYYPNSLLSKPGVCTSTTRPAAPYVGQVIFETDTLVARVWNGTAWQTFQLPNDISVPGFIQAGTTLTAGTSVTATTGPVVSRGTTPATGLHTGVAGSPAKIYSSAGDNFNIRTHTNTPNPNFSLGAQNGSGTDTAVPINWENGTLRLRGSGTTTATGIYIDSNNVPRYATPSNVYGWHIANEQIGTQLTIGAWAASGMSFSAANTWITIGSVGITVPSGVQVIEMIYGFTMFVSSGGGFQVRVYYNGGATAVSDFQYFRNNTFDHFAVTGPRGLGVQGGTSGTIFLQVYGQGITLNADTNDSGYFIVHTI